MRKRKNPCCLCVAATLATLVLALQPGIVVGDTLATQASSSIFISVDIPTASGQFGFTALDDINDRGAIVGGLTAGPVGFLLDAKTQFTDIECRGAITSTAPKSMNTRGEIAGFCSASGRIGSSALDRLSLPKTFQSVSHQNTFN